jgi:hypothetical protein
MLTERRTNCLNALSATIVAGLVTLPLAVAFAVDLEQTNKADSKGPQPASGRPAVLRGRVRNDEGASLADVRVLVAIPAVDMRFVDGSTPHKRMEVRSDAKGEYRLELSGITEPTTISIDAMKPGYRRLVGTLMSGGDARKLEVAPGSDTEAAPLILEPALYFAGKVVDEQGKPIAGVKISANVSFTRGSAGVERTASNADGSFGLFNYPTNPRIDQNSLSKGYVFFFHPDYIDHRINDVYALAPTERDAMRIILTLGYKVTGTVLDLAGKPVPNAMIKVTRKDGSHRKATLTDANGKFAVRGLSKGLTSLSVRALDIKQKTLVPMALNGDKGDLDVRLKKMEMPADLKSHAVLGMRLADVTRELRSAYDLFNQTGALVIDPGKNSDRLQIGQLAEGYTFWRVGNERIGSVREFVEQILAETAGQNAELYSVRVVYSFSKVEYDGNNTQYLKLTKDDLKQLQVVLDGLTKETR